MLNSCNFVGRLVKDPELKKSTNGLSVCTFNIAVQRSRKDANGNYSADFITCRVWRQPADYLCQYARKGTTVAVGGRLEVSTYKDSTGAQRYSHIIQAESVDILASGVSNQNNAASNAQYAIQNQQAQFGDTWYPQSTGGVDISNDDLPF